MVTTLSTKEFQQSRRFADTEFGRIAYVERGAGPAALFVHGALLHGWQWRHQLAGLADLRRVIAVDTLGMGYTELRPGQPLGLARQAEMLRAFVAALGLGAVDVVGNDSGGGAVQIFAAENPGAIRTLALTDCEVDNYDEDSEAAVRFRRAVQSGALVKAMKAALDDPAAGKRALAIAYQNVDALPDDLAATYFAPLVASPARIEQMLGYLAANTKKDLIAVRAKLQRLRAPALMLWGTADGFFPLKWAYWLKENLPNAEEVVEVPGASFFWPEEQPELLNRKLRDLWTRHAP